jgi:hypothetical protein
MIPNIRSVLVREFPKEKVGEHYQIRIERKGDVTGDGVPEALVYLGTGEGVRG